jgi:MtrB/PioB family decaheme-associated outer membrane protein
MKNQFGRWFGAAVVVGLFSIAGSALADGSDDSAKLDVDGKVRLGIRWLELDGDKAKFNEYRNVGKDFGFAAEEVMLRGYKGQYFFFVEGLELDRNGDRSAEARAGRFGSFEINLGWDETSHHFADDVPFLGTLQGGDYWSVPDLVQGALAPDFPLGTIPLTPALPGPNGVDRTRDWPLPNGKSNLLDLLDEAHRLDLDLVRNTGTIGANFTPVKNFNLRADYLRRDRNGFRPMSTGLYLRASQGATQMNTGLGENFTLYGLEFPEPIDYDENEFGVGFDYRGENWNVNLGYRYVDFDNNIDTVTWDNPLLLNSIDDVQNGAAMSRLDLFPSSNSNTLSFTGGIWDLPLDSRITTTVSWGRITQDDDFPAYTVNDALTVNGGPNAGALGALLALPANDLNGKVDTILVNARLSSRPIDPLAINLKINYYDYDNKSDRIHWKDGWARIGESEWGATSNWLDNDLFNRVPDWERTRVNSDASYRFNDMVTLVADYEFERYKRNSDRNADTNEHSVGGRIKVAPTSWSTLRAGYQWSSREIKGGYVPAPAMQFFEWDELRMFDQADRTRNSANIYLGVNPIERLSLSMAFTLRYDEYDNDYYGLQSRDGYTLGVDASYAFADWAAVFAYYSRDSYNSNTLTRTKSDATGGGSFAIPENDWRTKIDDHTNTIGGGASFTLIPEKLTLELSADYSFAKSEFDTSNTDFAAGITTASALAYDWPDTEIKSTQVRADLEYQWTERLSTSFRYLYERFKLDDSFVDSVMPYGNPDDSQGNTLDYYIFMDSNFSDYDAHLMTLTVTYEF